MESKKINQLATNLAPVNSDLTVIGDPVTGELKKITLLQIASLFGAGLTSVGMVVPSGFSVSPATLTSSGTFTITGSGTTAQYIDGTGALQTFPTLLSSDKLIHLVRNNSGATIVKGTIVYINGATGNKPTIAKALATSDATSAQTYGVVQADISNNADGNIVVIGDVENLDTSSVTEGTQLYLSGTTAGAYTTTKPYAPIHLVYVAVVLRSHPTLGIIGVKIQNGYEMDELHNVSAQSPSNNDGLFYNTTTSLWEKNTIAGVLGYTPVTSARTISTTSPLSGGGDLSADRTLSIAQATTSVSGYLSSTDWNTFNNKQATITLTTTGASGASTLISNTLNVPTYTLAGLGGFANPMTTLGDLIYGGTSGTATRIAGNITTTKQFLSQTGTGTVSAAPSWATITGSDITGAALTSVNDTNVTITLGGTPTTSLLRSTSITLGWTGTLADARIASAATWNAKENALTFSAPLSRVTNTISIPVATSLVNGYLSSTDWTTFNGKQSAITLTTTGSSGSATFVTNTLNIPTYTLSGLGGQPLATNLTSLAGLTYVSASFVKMTASGTFSLDTSTYLTSNQTITLSGDVSGSGTTAITTAIGANKVTNAMLAQIATSSFHGRVTAGTGNVETLTGTQATTILDVFTSALKGLAPASGGGTTNFLRADGTWAAPATGGTGTVTSVSVVSANGFAGTVATATTTPAITLSTTITGLLKGNGTAISAATSGTDYQAPSTNLTSLSGLTYASTSFVKMTASGTFSLDTNTYGTFTLPTLTSGSVLFSDGTTISQDNANFFWDNTNKRLGIGTISPANPLHVNGAIRLGSLLASTSATIGGVTAANASSVLDAISTTKGALLPRMTNAQVNAIATPATGLLAYATDATEGLYVKLSGSWQRFLTTSDGNIYISDGILTGARTISQGANLITFNASRTSSNSYSITSTQTSTNATDTSDGTLFVSYTLTSTTAAATQLVSRAFSFTALNNLTGAGSSITNMRVMDVQGKTNVATTTTNLDLIYILGGATASGSVTNSRGVYVRNLQGTSQAGLVIDDLSAASTNSTGLVINASAGAIPTGDYGIYQYGSALVNYFEGFITANKFTKIGGTSAQILAADGSVITAGTNITISAGTISSTGGSGTDFYTTDGTLTSARTISGGGFGLSYSDNKNNPTTFTISNTTSGTLSRVETRFDSDSTAFALFGKASSTYTTSNLISAGDTYIYNSAGIGNIVLQNLNTTGGIEFLTGGTGTTPTMTYTSDGHLLINTITNGTYFLDVNGDINVGGKVNIAAGTATRSPIDFTTTSAVLKTSPIGGDLEIDANGIAYYTHNTSERGIIPAEQFIQLTAAYTFASSITTAQKIFNSPTNGAVTLKSTTTYVFECQLNMTGLSTTTTSGWFGFAFGGTATITNITWEAFAQKTSGPSVPGTSNHTMNITASNSNISNSTGNANTNGFAYIKGIVRINAGGTFIPQVILGVGALATVTLGTYFKINAVGTSSVQSVGNWS